jgi:lactoylglutathione lyase
MNHLKAMVFVGIALTACMTQSFAEEHKSKKPRYPIMDYPDHPVDVNRTRINHVSLRVSDLDKSIEFYETFLGFRVIRTQDIGYSKAAFISTGGAEPIIELVQNRKYEPERIGPNSGHIGIFVADVDAIFEKMRAGGVNIAQKPFLPGPGAPYLGFVTDPDGYRIEVMENPKPVDCLSCHRAPHLD